MRILTGIPVYNEVRYVRRVLNEVSRFTEEIAVVDDGSNDGSREILQTLNSEALITHLIGHPENLGYGRALIDLIELARTEEYEGLVTLDCDEQHQPSQIPEFIKSLEACDCDIISGTRYPAKPIDGQDPPPEDRLKINRAITTEINELTGYKLTDSFCGFKAYGRRALESLDLKEPGYGMPLELWIKAAKAGLKVEEIPVHRIYKDRTRSFGGGLDIPDERLSYYKRVIEAAQKEARQ
ncbi:MAG: glycosyltransferase family 2 protein [Planctomycetota bacterium]|nr:glycosyltransferase family 2 protein [Planctomycetota bacterium]